MSFCHPCHRDFDWRRLYGGPRQCAVLSLPTELPLRAAALWAAPLRHAARHGLPHVRSAGGWRLFAATAPQCRRRTSRRPPICAALLWAAALRRSVRGHPGRQRREGLWASSGPVGATAARGRVTALQVRLDPVRLLRDMRTAQQQLIDIADRPFAPSSVSIRTPPIEEFLAGLRMAWKDGQVRPTARPKP